MKSGLARMAGGADASMPRVASILSTLSRIKSDPFLSTSSTGKRVLVVEAEAFPSQARMRALAATGWRSTGMGLAEPLFGKHLSVLDVAAATCIAVVFPARVAICGIAWAPDESGIGLLVFGKRFEVWTVDAKSGSLGRIGALRTKQSPLAFAAFDRGTGYLLVMRRGSISRNSGVHESTIVREARGDAIHRSSISPDSVGHARGSRFLWLTTQGARNASALPGQYSALRPSPSGRLFLAWPTLQQSDQDTDPTAALPDLPELWRIDKRVRRIDEFAVGLRGISRSDPSAPPARVSWHPLAPNWLIVTRKGATGTDGARHIVELWTAPFRAAASIIADVQAAEVSIIWSDRRTGLLTTTDASGRHFLRLLHRASTGQWHATLVGGRQVRYEDTPLALVPDRVPNRSGSACRLLSVRQRRTTLGLKDELVSISMRTGKAERLWRATAGVSEEIIAIVRGTTPRALIKRRLIDGVEICIAQASSSSHVSRRVYGLRDTTAAEPRRPSSLIHYTRSDGLRLSGHVHLPIESSPSRPVPFLIWGYPQAFTDLRLAQSVGGRAHDTTRLSEAVYLWLLRSGVGVLETPSFPLIASAEGIRDYRAQLRMNAVAAVEMLVERGFASRDRIAIGGHSYGAAMAVTLLAHSRLFCAGIACSGSYNRFTTPFGFQHERRPAWRAMQSFTNASPLLSVHRIKAPLLIIHGRDDRNLPTHPIQSETLFRAAEREGRIAKLVLLPHTGHVLASRQAVGRMLSETEQWLSCAFHRAHST